MNALRTPEQRFENLPGWPYAPSYVDDLTGFAGLRMHIVDEGPRDAPDVFLCLHGQPTWSYLYRRMIPVFLEAGARVVAPDFFGFGRSDKPAHEDFYTFTRHRDALAALIERLDLQRMTLVCQDWGGLLGLTLPMDMPQRFVRLLLMNTALATGDRPLGEGFIQWRTWANAHPDMAIGKLMARSCPHLSPAEAAAYDAPFPDATYKAGVRRFPNLVADRPDADGAALARRALEWLEKEWSGQSFMAIGATDPVLGPPVMEALRKRIRGCPEPMALSNAGHFVQEWGEDVAREAIRQWG